MNIVLFLNLKLTHFYCINIQKTNAFIIMQIFIANLYPDSVKLIRYLSSAVIAVLFNCYVGLLPGSKIFLFLLSVCTEELLSTAEISTFLSKINAFLPQHPSVHENCEQELSPMLQLLYFHLSGSAFLVTCSSKKAIT